MTFWKWSKTAASNGTADSTCAFPEGMAASGVNDSVRGLMAAAAKYRDDVSGTLITSGGSSNAYTATTNQTITSNLDGFRVSFVANHTNDGAATLAVDGQAAKPLRVATGAATPAGSIVSGSVYTASYEAGNEEWLLHGFFGDQTESPGVIKAYAGATAPTGYLLCYGQAISRTTYAALFAILSTTYGTGDGSTTFNIPDIRGRVVAGQDDMGGSSANRLTGLSGGVDGDTLGATGGSESHTLAQAQLPNVTLTTTIAAGQGSHTHPSGLKSLGTFNGGSEFTLSQAGTGITTGAATLPAMSGTTPTGGSDTPFNIVQPTIVLNYIIKT